MKIRHYKKKVKKHLRKKNVKFCRIEGKLYMKVRPSKHLPWDNWELTGW